MQIITNIRTVLPRLTRARFSGFGENHDRSASDWAWANLYEISSIIRCHYFNNQMGEWIDFGLGADTANDLFGRYGLLNGVRESKPLITWASLGSVKPTLVIDGDRPTHPPIDPHFVYVPMLWAKNSIIAAEFGICRVTSAQLDTGVRFGHNNDRFLSSQLIGHSKDGKKYTVLPDGSGGYRYTSIPQ